MNTTDRAYTELLRIRREAASAGFLQGMHPLTKLLCTLLAILMTASLSKYDMAGVVRMAVYPAILFIVGEIPFGRSLRRLWVVLPFLALVGIANPFLDREVLFRAAGIAVTGGWISFAVLLGRGAVIVFSTYLLAVTTPMEEICAALRMLRVPKILVTQMLLMFRYLFLLMEEAQRMSAAYRLRAPGQIGISVRAWGSFAGNLLLRSADRAQTVYESMRLRGFEGMFPEGKKRPFRAADGGQIAAVTILLLALRWGIPMLSV